ncbi:MAG TPA: SDR family oxidoreductase [Devosia sp.]|jgi:NAD(P)-dependent dehydrogenase (short-subunit alcohol dehydrogenase family)|nr:SDR family oxidoreductase [Devosia sp.]
MDLPRTPRLRLDGQHALVTGGTRGIGLAAAAALAEAGAAVTVVARRGADVDATVAALTGAGYRASGSVLDVTDYAAVRDLVERAPEPFDILVNSAGAARHASFLNVTEVDYRAVLDLNLGATLFASQAVAARLVSAGRAGSIIHISSQMGLVGGPQRSVYAASKFAVEGLTKAMAIDLAPHNIRVNTICPTFVETELSARNLSDPEFRAWVLAKIKLGRLARLEDMMGPVVFLASDAAAMMTGSSLVVDGGWTAE